MAKRSINSVPAPLPPLPIDQMPAFARKMIAVWRWKHGCAGEELSVNVYPGEWPADVKPEVKGCRVVEEPLTASPRSVFVLGRVPTGAWRMVQTVATPDSMELTPQSLAIVCAYAEVDDDAPLKVWMHEDPLTGVTPVWEIPVTGGPR